MKCPICDVEVYSQELHVCNHGAINNYINSLKSTIAHQNAMLETACQWLDNWNKSNADRYSNAVRLTAEDYMHDLKIRTPVPEESGGE